MLFLKRFWEPIARGEVTVTFRRWKAQQVLAGRRYRTAAGIIEIESVSVWEVESITDDEARRAGHSDASSLIADLPVRPGLPLYRIQFHVVDDPDPRAELAARTELQRLRLPKSPRGCKGSTGPHRTDPGPGRFWR